MRGRKSMRRFPSTFMSHYAFSGAQQHSLRATEFQIRVPYVERILDDLSVDE